MAEQVAGKLEIQDGAGTVTRITLDGGSADIVAGGGSQHGDLVLRDAAGQERVRLGRVTESTSAIDDPSPTVVAQYWGLRVKDAEGRNTIQLGRSAANNPTTPNVPVPQAAVDLILGGNDVTGRISLRDAA